MQDKLQELLRRFPNGKENEILAPYTYFKVGGPAKLFYHPQTAQEFLSLLRAVQELALPFIVLGSGANVLISDQGFDGVVIRSGGKQITLLEDNVLEAEADVPLSLLMNSAAQHGLSGMEFLAGIPGTVGGGIFGNAGNSEYGLGNKSSKVEGLDTGGTVKLFTPEECAFAYRTSVFKQQGGVVLRAWFPLQSDDPVAIRSRINENLLRKREVQPLKNASAGCIFTNPPGQSAGRLIDQAGLKGKEIGGAQVSTQHANFIVNTGEAKAEHIIMLISYIKQQIRDSYGVQLHEEIRYIGF